MERCRHARVQQFISSQVNRRASADCRCTTTAINRRHKEHAEGLTSSRTTHAKPLIKIMIFLIAHIENYFDSTTINTS